MKENKVSEKQILVFLEKGESACTRIAKNFRKGVPQTKRILDNLVRKGLVEKKNYGGENIFYKIKEKKGGKVVDNR